VLWKEGNGLNKVRWSSDCLLEESIACRRITFSEGEGFGLYEEERIACRRKISQYPIFVSQ
jgi:hypothetical protein